MKSFTHSHATTEINEQQTVKNVLLGTTLVVRGFVGVHHLKII